MMKGKAEIARCLTFKLNKQSLKSKDSNSLALVLLLDYRKCESKLKGPHI